MNLSQNVKQMQSCVCSISDRVQLTIQTSKSLGVSLLGSFPFHLYHLYLLSLTLFENNFSFHLRHSIHHPSSPPFLCERSSRLPFLMSYNSPCVFSMHNYETVANLTFVGPGQRILQFTRDSLSHHWCHTPTTVCENC